MRLLIFIFLLIPISIFTQSIDHWETIVHAEDEWHYHLPSVQPSIDWKTIGFDDSSWSLGDGGFGYSDGDDNTIVSATSSIYLRKEFTIESLEEIEYLVFNMDFDDGFVAYLNGVEIARENVGVPGDIPPFDLELDIDIEAVMYEGGYPSTHQIPEFIDVLLTGTNVLAIEVHNVSINSSDLSVIPFLHFGMSNEEIIYNETPSWFLPPYFCDENIEESYVVTMNTEAWGNEVAWEIQDLDGNVLFFSNGFSDNSIYEEEICLPDDCYYFFMLDTYGDGWNGGSFFMEDYLGNVVLSGALESGSEEILLFSLNGDCVIEGCNIEGAINYNPLANTDDGSCVFFNYTDLPIVMIDTDNQGIQDDPRIVAHMGIIDNEDGDNSTANPFNGYDGQIAIEIRGSSSQMFPKKSYSFETQDSLGFNNNVSLIGMPEENDWILHAPYSDKSQMRNVITFELGRRIGRYTPRTEYCELFVDGDYKGIYVLMENIKRDENRVDIATLLPQDIEGDELTGGYILKIDKFTGDGGEGWTSDYPTVGGLDLHIKYHKPETDELMDEQKAYIQNHIDEFEDALFGANFTDTAVGYPAYIDIPSFQDLYLINEFSRNIDGYRLSTYFHKQKDSDGGKIIMGPWWDYNLSFGNADYCDGYSPEGWEVEGGDCGGNNPDWFYRLMDDEHYENTLKCRWSDYRANAWSNDSITLLVDSLDDLLAEAQVRNFARWGTLGEYVWPNYYIGDSYFEEINILRNWMTERLEWIDGNILGECTMGCTDPLALNYDPEAIFDDGSCDYIDSVGEITLRENGKLLKVTDITGREVPINSKGLLLFIYENGVVEKMLVLTEN